MARQVLIAGYGDLGSRIARLFAERGDRVQAISRRGRGADGVDGIAADLGEQPLALPVLGPVDVLVFALAPDQRDEGSYRAVYIDALANLLAALAQRGAAPGRLIFVSSSAASGDSAGAWVDETDCPPPDSWNGQVLLEAERHAVASCRSSVVLRLAGIYGPGRTRMLQWAVAGRGASAQAWTNRIHVEDAARAVVHLAGLARPQNCYFGGDERPATECEVVQFIARTLGAPLADCLDGPPSGKRLSSQRLKASGFEWRYPDFEIGYRALIAESRK